MDLCLAPAWAGDPDEVKGELNLGHVEPSKLRGPLGDKTGQKGVVDTCFLWTGGVTTGQELSHSLRAQGQPLTLSPHGRVSPGAPSDFSPSGSEGVIHPP